MGSCKHHDAKTRLEGSRMREDGGWKEEEKEKNNEFKLVNPPVKLVPVLVITTVVVTW